MAHPARQPTGGVATSVEQQIGAETRCGREEFAVAAPSRRLGSVSGDFMSASQLPVCGDLVLM
jgi:hypothetical protein